MTEYTDIEKRDALGAISNLMGQAANLFAEAEQIAEKYGLEFDDGFLPYGMGGTYVSEEAASKYTASIYNDTRKGWNASSHSC